MIDSFYIFLQLHLVYERLHLTFFNTMITCHHCGISLCQMHTTSCKSCGLWKAQSNSEFSQKPIPTGTNEALHITPNKYQKTKTAWQDTNYKTTAIADQTIRQSVCKEEVGT